ncbi:uncharacterized protein LOC132603631 isoform X1 [Lycium barbarum]|uniref:uncharacterized protein LOC132603631 isoform X1 n=1 Tax=Lycium barbarum TaxID=112863 RepID=UPI00293F1F91|nr:uncharacterized protein LOC132603631 isoform X1 [Lycium barbarum]XP_060172749.1 uncharacterized protein LOC132603631 isoform X1 [Lycium barbarum]XP_060172750.1 uncharacterized protein LOC132603631 isoform X1 [Lycium barbarum]
MARKRQRNSSQDRLLSNSSEQQGQQVESGAMPEPPQNWPRNERQPIQSGNLSRNDSHDIENLPDYRESEEQSKRPRGPTMMHSGWGKDGDNLHVELNDRGQVIGPEAARLHSKLGVIARNGILAPLNHRDWRLVPDMYKDIIWSDIKENTYATDDMRRILMMSVGSKWKEWKHEAKSNGYDPYNTDIERLAHRPKRVAEDQWRSLVHYWSSKEAKEKSERNKESRKKLTMPHTSGRKSLAQIIDDMTKENTGVKPTRIEVWKKTHTRENKQPVNDIAGEVMKQMDDLAKVYPELNVPGSARNDIYSQVMGPDTHGIVRTLGKGAAPSLVYGPVYKRSQLEQRDFDARVEIEVQKATVAIQIDMDKNLAEAKQNMEAKMDERMDEKVKEKVKAEMQAYVQSIGFMNGSNNKSISNEELSHNSVEDRQQSLSPVSVVPTKKVNLIKNTTNNGVDTQKKNTFEECVIPIIGK